MTVTSLTCPTTTRALCTTQGKILLLLQLFHFLPGISDLYSGRAWSKCKSAKCITIETRDPAMQNVLFGLFAIIAGYIYAWFWRLSENQRQWVRETSSWWKSFTNASRETGRKIKQRQNQTTTGQNQEHCPNPQSWEQQNHYCLKPGGRPPQPLKRHQDTKGK